MILKMGSLKELYRMLDQVNLTETYLGHYWISMMAPFYGKFNWLCKSIDWFLYDGNIGR